LFSLAVQRCVEALRFEKLASVITTLYIYKKERARAAMAEARAEAIKASDSSELWATSSSLVFIELDLTSIGSVRLFVQRFLELFDSLDLLVLNAGLNTEGLTPDNLDQRWQVNFFSQWFLTSQLLFLLAMSRGPRNDGGRIVLLSSVMHHHGSANNFESHSTISDLKFKEGNLSCNESVYSDSKLAMNVLAFELQRRIDSFAEFAETPTQMGSSCKVPTKRGGPRLRPRVVVVNPGAVSSDIWRGVSFYARLFVLDPVMSLLFLNTDEGSATSVFAALQPLPDHRPDLHEGYIPPYFVPYWIPIASMPLPFEYIGPFVGVRQAQQSLPPNITSVSLSLWQLSERTVIAIDESFPSLDKAGELKDESISLIR